VEIDRRSHGDSHQVSGVFSGSAQNPKHKIEITKKWTTLCENVVALLFFGCVDLSPYTRQELKKKARNM
jgi:hypothetical protein